MLLTMMCVQFENLDDDYSGEGTRTMQIGCFVSVGPFPNYPRLLPHQHGEDDHPAYVVDDHGLYSEV